MCRRSFNGAENNYNRSRCPYDFVVKLYRCECVAVSRKMNILDYFANITVAAARFIDHHQAAHLLNVSVTVKLT